MARLKSHTKWPPGGFQVLHPEVAMKKPFSGSWNEAVEFERKFRIANPTLCVKFGWKTSPDACAEFVDSYNAARCVSGGWLDWVMPEGVANFPQAQKKTVLGTVAAVVRSTRAALDAYATMFGKTGPVGKPLAETRAVVCAGCPQNDTKGGLADHFTAAAADEVMGLLGALKDLDVRVADPDKLGVCRACSCPLRAKVFANLDSIVKHLQPDVWAQLPENCWMRTEAKR